MWAYQIENINLKLLNSVKHNWEVKIWKNDNTITAENVDVADNNKAVNVALRKETQNCLKFIWFTPRLLKFSQLQRVCYNVAMRDHHSFLCIFSQYCGLDKSFVPTSTYR